VICRVHTLSLYMLTEDGVEFKGSLYMVYGVHDGDDDDDDDVCKWGLDS